MQKLPVLSGRELIKALAKAGFEARRRKGSHIVLVKEGKRGRKAIVVPDHEELDKGTLFETGRTKAGGIPGAPPTTREG